MTRNVLLIVGIVLFVVSSAMARPARPGLAAEDINTDEILEQPVRLEFSVVPSEENMSIFLVVATSNFETSTKLHGENKTLLFHASGRIAAQEDGKFFINYYLNALAEDEKGEMECTIESSALLKDGQELEIATMGNKTLFLHISTLKTDK